MYRENARPVDAEEVPMTTVIVRWVSMTAMVAFLGGYAACVAVNRHSDDAMVAKAHDDAVRAADDAVRQQNAALVTAREILAQVRANYGAEKTAK